MPEEFVPILAAFHQDVLLPDFRRVVREEIGAEVGALRAEMQTGFDGLAQRLDRLETEYPMFVAGLKRVEERLDRMAFKADVQDLKRRVDELERRVNELDAS